MLIEFILMLIGSYLLGSVPAAYLVVKWFKGKDIRNIGSGNVGSSNVAHTTSKRLAVAGAVRYGQGGAGFVDSPSYRPFPLSRWWWG
jgi:glycerol-3-phosphate acyltransferase PlsY